ncbi:MAG: glycosyltransferase [Lachnospiraceae bacterium]|nr:glycosyltransferase [Lachnospiraceae bacterium]
MTYPLCSVCIPAYRNASYIGETITSVLNQTYPNLELVICDDCSPDNTVEVIRSFSDERIRLFQNEKNLGMSGNWNNCLSKCRGEFIKLLCADDLLAPDALEKEVRALMDHPEALFSESDTRLIRLDGKFRGWYKRYKKSGLVDGKETVRACFFSQDYYGAPLANTFRRSAYEKYGGFDTDFVYILDYEFFVRLAIHGPVYIIHEPLNYFRVRNDSNTGEVIAGDKTEAYVKEHELLLKKHGKAVGLTERGFKKSVRIRKLRNFAANIYLKLFVHK